MTLTSYENFLNQIKESKIAAVSTDVLVDMETPVSTFIKVTQGDYRFLLESVEKGVQRGRYSIIGDSPLVIFKAKNHSTELFDVVKQTVKKFDENPFDILQTLFKEYAHESLVDIPFIHGGLFGYFGYDTIRYIEKLPDTTKDDVQLPDIHAFVPGRIIVFDNLVNKISVIRFVIPGNDPKKDYDEAFKEISEICRTLKSGQMSNNGHSNPVKNISSGFTSNVEKQDFIEMVEKTKKYIQQGDIFQGVLSQRLEVETEAEPFNIYRALRVINPSPYMYYLEMDDVKVIGSSPEALVKLTDGRVSVKPIAGTRKRGANDDEDDALIQDLLNDPKERAEHTMLVDLGRNDVGRVAEYGSVAVEDFMTIEKYSHVIHIVSTVSGQLRPKQNAVDVFKACFPAGTVSGAPKVRAMEIIEELEPTRRAIYSGAVGYFNFNGDMDVCIAIRTIYYKDGKAYLQAGAGIVADSVPENEYEETLNKARGLLRAIEYAEGGLDDFIHR